MTDLVQAAFIAKRLTECRDAAKFIFGDRYLEKIKPHCDAIHECAAMDKTDVTKAAIRMAKEIDSGEATVLIMAALAEIMDPSDVQTSKKTV